MRSKVVELVTNTTYREAAKVVGQSLQAGGGVHRAADVLRATLRARGSEYLQVRVQEREGERGGETLCGYVCVYGCEMRERERVCVCVCVCVCV